jgi:methionyl-tRNA formyltransferase
VVPVSAGTIIRAEGDSLEFASGDGQVVRILTVQPEARRVMSAREFLAGRPIAPDARLERG